MYARPSYKRAGPSTTHAARRGAGPGIGLVLFRVTEPSRRENPITTWLSGRAVEVLVQASRGSRGARRVRYVFAELITLSAPPWSAVRREVPVINAREIMTPGAHVVHTDETVAYAARLMAEHEVGALVLCGPEESVRGVVTDRDLVRQVVAADHDAATWPVGRLERDEAVTVDADDVVDDVLATMITYQLRRVPVLEGPRLAGMVSVADVARHMPNPRTGDLVSALSAS